MNFSAGLSRSLHFQSLIKHPPSQIAQSHQKLRQDPYPATFATHLSIDSQIFAIISIINSQVGSNRNNSIIIIKQESRLDYDALIIQ